MDIELWSEVLEGWCEDEWDDYKEDREIEYRPLTPDTVLGSPLDNKIVRALFGLPDWRALDQRWIEACAKSFYNIPELPQPKKITELAKELGLNSKETRQYLQSTEEWIKLNNWYWIRNDPIVRSLIVLCNKKNVEPSQVILALIRIRKHLKEHRKIDPTRDGLKKIIGINAVNLLVRIKFLRALRLWTKKTVVYFVPSNFWEKLRESEL